MCFEITTILFLNTFVFHVEDLFKLAKYCNIKQYLKFITVKFLLDMDSKDELCMYTKVKDSFLVNELSRAPVYVYVTQCVGILH